MVKENKINQYLTNLSYQFHITPPPIPPTSQKIIVLNTTPNPMIYSQASTRKHDLKHASIREIQACRNTSLELITVLR